MTQQAALVSVEEELDELPDEVGQLVEACDSSEEGEVLEMVVLGCNPYFLGEQPLTFVHGR